MTINISIFYLLNNLTRYQAVALCARWCAVVFPFIVIVGGVIFLLLRLHFAMNSRVPLKNFSEFLREGALIFLSVLSAWIITEAIKQLVHLNRPFAMLPSVHQLFSESGYSFPSGHATVFAALATALYMIDRRAGIIFWICAIIISVARIISGVHFPLDIIAGFCVGSITTLIIHLLVYQRKSAAFSK